MEHALNLFIRSIFADNMIFAYFLGMCSYLAVSKNVKTSAGLGVAVTFVLVVTLPINYLLQTQVLDPLNLGYLSFILFIAVIPAADRCELRHHGWFALHAAAYRFAGCRSQGYHRSLRCIHVRTRFRYRMVHGYRLPRRYS